MDSVDARRNRLTLPGALAGLQAGVAGSLLMLGWRLVASFWTRQSFWSLPNLYAMAFYGSGAFVNGFTRGSWSGLALILVICGVFGVVWGIAWGAGRAPFLLLVGAATGLAVYYLLFHLILPRTSPLIALYAPETEIRIGYMIWGMALSRSPRYARSIAESIR